MASRASEEDTYARISRSFALWLRQRLRGKPIARELGHVLAETVHSTGIEWRPVMEIAALIDSTPEATRDALADLERVGFLKYDHDTEFVWVVEAASWQVNCGSPENRRRLVARGVRPAVGVASFWPEYFAKYDTLLGLSAMGFTGGIASLNPSENHGSNYGGMDAPIHASMYAPNPSDKSSLKSSGIQDQEQDQEQEQVGAPAPACTLVREAPSDRPTDRPTGRGLPAVIAPSSPAPAPAVRLAAAPPPVPSPPVARPPEPMPTRKQRSGPTELAVWALGDVEDRLGWLKVPPCGTPEPALARLRAELLAATERAWGAYRDACEAGDGGWEVDGDAWDCVARAVLWLVDKRSLSPDAAAERLERIVRYARANPGLGGKDSRAWRWPRVVFGEAEGVTRGGRRVGVDGRLVQHWNETLAWEGASARASPTAPVEDDGPGTEMWTRAFGWFDRDGNPLPGEAPPAWLED